MKHPARSRRSKGLTRALVRRGARSSKAPLVAQKRSERLREPTICASCGAIFLHRTWRRRSLAADRLDGASWDICPACAQVRRGEYYGRVVARNPTRLADRDAIVRRIRNVGRRSAFTQPERRIVSFDFDEAGLEVLTTSQRLAHRIARELVKAFGGRASFRWSGEDGSLLATWETAQATR
jgi:NMD protein affecting ribosome stability and mRNA decay